MNSISKNIIIIEKHFKLFFRNSLSKYNLNTAEAMVLLLLYQKQSNPACGTIEKMHKGLRGKTQEELVGEIHYDKSVMTRTMQSLESKGYVLRNSNPQDSRSYVFTLTETAINFKSTLLGILELWNDHLLEGVPAQNVEVTQQTLSQMSGNIIKLIKGESL